MLTSTRVLAAVSLLFAAAVGAAPPPALRPPEDTVLQEAGALIEAMKRNERGPYSRIRWFCKDGSVHPPAPYVCAKRGGGYQYAEYSDARARLVELGWHVGTVYAALGWEEFWGTDTRHLRLRELPLERYLESIDDGWVLRRARHYRGRVQIEDEEQAGRALLLRLLGERDWVRENFLLVRELARVVPHGTAGDRTREVRQLAQDLAEQVPGFMPLRIEVHSRPSSGTASQVEAWASRTKGMEPGQREKAAQLAAGLEQIYGASGRRARLRAAADILAKGSTGVAQRVREAERTEGMVRIAHLARAMQLLRADMNGKDAAFDLRRIDLMLELEAELRTAALTELERTNLTRRELLTLGHDLLRAAWGGGYLSYGEHAALSEPLDAILAQDIVTASDYAFGLRRLGRAAAWAALTVQHAFSEALVRYTALDPRSGRFVDELLRASVLLPLGELAHRLALDGAEAAGLTHLAFGVPVSGLLGINPGVARGRLRVLDPAELAAGATPAVDEIVILTQTVADLTPVAGILTLGEGNPVSHVQMLARNLGIPNAGASATLLPRLLSHAGEQVLLAVSGDGRVLIEALTHLPAAYRAPAAQQPAAGLSKVQAPRPDLAARDPLPLAELHAGLSGRVVGPKAANVGELNRRFPGRIAPAVALPFGVFAAHTTGMRERLSDAFRRHHAGELDQSGLDELLDRIRAEVGALQLESRTREVLTAAMQQEFGTGEGYGVFVRSDTNVEDLPEFTGAGLNETVPNVIGLERQLAAVTRVWSSVYSRRAMAWRARILDDPENVYASVLLMRSVPSEKSGVLVTADLVGGGEGVTASIAWGVGGAVDNESAASLVLRPDGTSLLLGEAKAPYQRRLSPAGGILWTPAPTGPVLTEAEQQALRELAAEVEKQNPPSRDARGQALPWDVEFAFAEGRLWLLQIRPLVQRGHVVADRLVDALLPRSQPVVGVELDVAPAKLPEDKR